MKVDGVNTPVMQRITKNEVLGDTSRTGPLEVEEDTFLLLINEAEILHPLSALKKAYDVARNFHQAKC